MSSGFRASSDRTIIFVVFFRSGKGPLASSRVYCLGLSRPEIYVDILFFFDTSFLAAYFDLFVRHWVGKVALVGNQTTHFIKRAFQNFSGGKKICLPPPPCSAPGGAAAPSAPPPVAPPLVGICTLSACIPCTAFLVPIAYASVPSCFQILYCEVIRS